MLLRRIRKCKYYRIQEEQNRISGFALSKPKQSGGQTGAGNVVPTGVEMEMVLNCINCKNIHQGQLTKASEKWIL